MRKVSMLLLAGIVLISCNSKDGESAIVKEASTETASKPPVEFADAKLADMGKVNLRHFEDGRIDEWADQFADNAVYVWSAGDSLVGKQAILDYWKKRRSEMIENIKFTNDIWLPITVNASQQAADMVGTWLLSWYQVDVTYKNSKALSFWVHTDFHFNEQNKVDRAVQYIDRAPIAEAMGAK
jgi:hypothetical protein